MKVYLNSPYGYCQGVQRAISMALSYKKANPKNEVYVLGTLVHNENVTNELEKYGVHSLYSKISNEEKIKSLKKRSLLIFSAHGHDKKLEDLCNKKGIQFLDATCPIVELTRDNIIKEIENNHQVIYVGTLNHPECLAMLSISKNVFLYDDIKTDMKNFISDDSPFVSNQTTLSIYELDEIFNKIKSIFPNARFQNEICRETKLRQEGIKKLPNDVDAVFVVGGKESSNTLKLYELCKKYFTTLKIFKIIDQNDIDKKALVGCRSAAVISGASTPIMETMKIKTKLEDIW